MCSVMQRRALVVVGHVDLQIPYCAERGDCLDRVDGRILVARFQERVVQRNTAVVVALVDVGPFLQQEVLNLERGVRARFGIGDGVVKAA